jgi:hypothetical protein
MKVLFSALHLAYFRNFESVVRELAARGHRVHLSGDEPEALGGRELAERLAAEYPSVTWDLLPSLDEEPWFAAARKLRVGLDYVRVLEPRYAASPKLRFRTEERTPRAVRWAAAVPVVGPPLTRAALTRLERLMPRSAIVEDYLRRHAPDVVVLASLTYSRSCQLDLLKAARDLARPVAAAIMSWDHLSSKALVHLWPDLVLVWNGVQRSEAVEMHGIPADRVTVTGAQCYDQWFTRPPARGRDEFCRALGLRPGRPFVLWVHSALSPTPAPPEPTLVLRWIEALRGSPDPALRELGVLVRPHPERLKEWAGVDLARFDNVAFAGRNPIDAAAKDDYFDALYHSRAVVGMVTSAFLEAAIVGRPVLTFTLPEYRMHQEEMAHFRYLTTVEGGLLRSARDIESHLGQLREALALDGARDERNRRFVQAFIRPGGLDRPATPAFADALERLVREGTRRDPTLDQYAALRPLVGAAASLARTGAGRWLLLDTREEGWDDDRERKRRRKWARRQAKEAHHRRKVRRRRLIAVRDALLGAAKEAKSAFRRVRHRTAVTACRILVVTGVRRQE